MLKSHDTIAARATPPGIGGVGIIRVSGPQALSIAREILHYEPKPRVAHFCCFFKDKTSAEAGNQHVIDQGLAIYFTSPNSFTGEDVLELQGHGGQMVMERLLRRVLELGARLAKPGEFILRAFLNYKLDLAQVEAVSDLINATSEQAATYAVRSLQGEFSGRINRLITQLIDLRAQVEATIDFSEEEDVAQKTNIDINRVAADILQQLYELQDAVQQGVQIREGATIVIAGRANAGKSSLFNYLSKQEHAIVTDIPGTTRDVLRGWIKLDDVVFNLLDTAGFNLDPDVIEAEGMRRAQAEINKADHILWVVDITKQQEDAGFLKELLTRNTSTKEVRVTVLYNKIDLISEQAKVMQHPLGDAIYLSIKEEQGLDLLKQHLKTSVDVSTTEDGFSARRRHIDALERATKYLQNSVDVDCINATCQLELIAEDLRATQEVLGEITGVVTSEDILGKIFAEFCVGK